MANIETELRAFKNAKKGEDVRDSMISAIRKINTVNEEGVEEIAEKTEQMVEVADSMIQIDEEPTEYTKLKLETAGQDIEIVTLEELDDQLPETEIGEEVIDARTGYDETIYNSLGEAIRTQVSDLKNDFDDITISTENIFDMSVFDGVEGITKDASGYYTGTGQAFANVFGSGVSGLTFEANSQYFLSVVAYTDGNASTSEVNGLQFSFYDSNNTRIGRKSILNNTQTPARFTLFSTGGNSVSRLTIGVSNSALNIWHIKDIMLCKSSVEQEYVPHVTANDITARKMASQSVYTSDLAGEKVSGGYISLQKKFVGDTVDLTPVTNTSMSYVLLDCEEDDCFVITSTGLSAAKTYAFIDSNNVMTEVCDASNLTLTDYAVIAPSSGKLIVNSVNNQSFALRKVANAVEVELVNEGQFLRETNKSYRWKGKKIVTFGDSRTWYDGHLYTENTKSEWTGKVCVGYQQQMRNILMTEEVSNQGASGYTSAQICELIRAFDFTDYDAVFLEGGVNDFVKSSQVTIGEIQPIGSTFDTTTVYGAWQSAIEYILTNYPSVLIYIDIPAIAWTSAGVFPYNTAKIKGEIAELYNLPCLDLYKESGINEVNRDYWYCDDVQATNWRLHFNDYGNELIGAKIAEFINTH